MSGDDYMAYGPDFVASRHWYEPRKDPEVTTVKVNGLPCDYCQGVQRHQEWCTSESREQANRKKALDARDKDTRERHERAKLQQECGPEEGHDLKDCTCRWNYENGNDPPYIVWRDPACVFHNQRPKHPEGVEYVLKPAARPVLNLEELLVGDVNRLRRVRRYGRSIVFQTEYVAEHIFYTTLYCYWIAKWVEDQKRTYDNGFPIKVEMERLLARAIFHDQDEAMSGDIDRPFKYADPRLKFELHRVAEMMFKDMLSRTWGGDAELVEGLMEGWNNNKDETIEGRVLALADYLAFIAYVWQERCHVNFTMAVHIESAKEYTESFKDPSFDFLRPLIDQAYEIINKVLFQGGDRPFRLEQ
jgi:5'-deoxynucleotidase YfbR-like HD superfamily hydrolase